MSASRLLVILAALALLTSVVAVFMPSITWPLLIADTIVVVLTLIDWGLARVAVSRLSAEVDVATLWSRGRRQTIHYQLLHRHGFTSHLRVRPDAPSHMLHAEPYEIQLRIAGNSATILEFSAICHQRGQLQSAGLHVEIRGVLGLCLCTTLLPAPFTAAIYPDLKPADAYRLLAKASRSQRGVRRRRAIGGDNEFESLRPYQRGDPLNRIDWKATARREELISRAYQVSQYQRINIMIDHGVLMGTQLTNTHGGSRSMLDEVIDAAMLLAYVALRQQDLVGLTTFADTVTSVLPAQGGPRRLAALVHAVHDVKVRDGYSRFDQAMLQLAQQEPKRSLVVLMSHVLDASSIDLLLHHLPALRRRHLPLVVLLRNPDVQAMLPGHQEQFDSGSKRWWQAAAASDIANERRSALDQLRQAGCLVIDCQAQDLSAELVSSYLEVKAHHLL